MLETIIAFILVFGIIVVIHEFGHFYFAKKAGILVREFSIGFGPKIFSYRKGETTYTIRILPLGGYVMMAGYEEEEDLRPGMPVTLFLDNDGKVTKIDTTNSNTDIESIPVEIKEFDLENQLFIEGIIDNDINETEMFYLNRDAVIVKENGLELQIAPSDRRFQNAPLLSRIITNFAGPMNNFILAIIAFIVFAFLQGGVPSNEPVIGQIQEDSVASETVLEESDEITAVDGESTESWNELVTIIQESPNEEITLEIEKENGEIVEEMVTPETVEANEGTTIGRIGIVVSMDTSLMAKISFGFTQTWGIISGILSLLATIFTGGFTIDNLGGPVAIYSATETVVQSAGFLGIVSFMASLSVNLGIVNLLPIPGLDGGKLLLNFVEGIRGKPLSEEKEGILTLISVGLLLLLMILVTWNDIQRFFF